MDATRSPTSGGPPTPVAARALRGQLRRLLTDVRVI
jgi:hypothetical protein